MKCKNCGRDDVYVDDVDGLCDACYDFVAGHTSYDPAEPNPMLELIQAALEDAAEMLDPDDYPEWYPDDDE